MLAKFVFPKLCYPGWVGLSEKELTEKCTGDLPATCAASRRPTPDPRNPPHPTPPTIAAAAAAAAAQVLMEQLANAKPRWSARCRGTRQR